MSAAVDTSAVRSAVTAVPGVVRVNGRGPNGVSADDAELEVHVVAQYGEVLPDLAARVDRELAPLLGGRSLRFVVDDVTTDAEEAARPAEESADSTGSSEGTADTADTDTPDGDVDDAPPAVPAG